MGAGDTGGCAGADVRVADTDQEAGEPAQRSEQTSVDVAEADRRFRADVRLANLAWWIVYGDIT